MDTLVSLSDDQAPFGDQVDQNDTAQNKYRQAVDELLASSLHDAEKVRHLRRMIAYTEQRLRDKWLDALS